jgi:MarR family transcriptional regulator, organic hydroperoxide resistance regulator
VSTSTQADVTAAQESWELIRDLWMGNFPRTMALFAEFDLAKQQAFALVHLQPDEPKPMSELAASMFCDASNITGIADRLEARGLVERVPAAHDRRVKTLVLTPEGVRVRGILAARLAEPPESVTSLSAADQRTLRDILRRAAGLA